MYSVYMINTIVYTEGTSAERTLCIWDPVNGRRVISSGIGERANARIYGNTVVWEDYRSGVFGKVYVWDPVNGERPITNRASSQYNPSIWGDTIAWTDRPYSDIYNQQRDAFVWNPTDGETRLAWGMSNPVVLDDKVYMTLETYWPLGQYSTPMPDSTYLYRQALGGGQATKLIDMLTVNVSYLSCAGSVVTWTAGGGSTIQAWDPVNGYSKVNVGTFDSAVSPWAYGRSIVWVGDGDIYLSTLVPEPSSLTVLAVGLAGLLGTALRRRRH